MPPLHGQHQTILMFLSLYDVNSSEDQTIKPCGKGLMIWSALVFVLVRVTLSVIEANHLSRTAFFAGQKSGVTLSVIARNHLSRTAFLLCKKAWWSLGGSNS
jgi:hypothetical protein